MREATLIQVLEAREKRVKTQKQLLSAYKTSLICFTLNIAGPVKTSPIIERAFFEGVNLLEERFKKNIAHSETHISVTGCEGFICVSKEAKQVKNICIDIENNHPLGRLFDMDVIDSKGEKLTRTDLRGCIVCAKKGRECAAGRLHSVEELQTVTNKIITNYFLLKDANCFGTLAYESLVEEVYTTPKAGLVDRNNNGSHRDMNIALFEKSANSLKPYFCRCFEIGVQTQNLPCDKAFEKLRKAGIEAEKIMFEATGGVNTHKGAIYSLGVLCGAVGRLWKAEKYDYKTEEVLALCSDLTKKAVEQDFANIDTSTVGGRLYRDYGLLGIRGEVVSGFFSVKNIGLPIFLKALDNGFSKNDAGAITLVHLISKVEDTTVYNRGGKSGASFAKKSAKELLEISCFPTVAQMEQLDNEFISRNLSAGGCADLLAVTYFLYKLNLQK